MKHKNLVVGGLMTATLLSGGVFAMSASAHTSSDRADNLASKIATKFNLNKDDVKKILDEDRAEHQAEHQAERLTRAEERLTQAVKDGKLTEDQKTKALEYIKSQQTFFDSLKDKTHEERKTAMQAHRDEVKKWAEDNGIDAKYLMMMGGRGGMHGGPSGNRGELTT